MKNKEINLSKIITLNNRIAKLTDDITNPRIAERYKTPWREELEAAKAQRDQMMSLLSSMIREAEGRARERKLTPQQILDAIAAAESTWDLPKKWLPGIRISVDVNAQNFPGTYKGIPESTCFTAERRSTGWVLVKVARAMCASEGCNIYATLPVETLEYIAQRAREQAKCIKILQAGGKTK